jgi:hypothetical protein
MKRKRQFTGDMSSAAIDVKPIEYDWTAHQVGDGDGDWEWWDAVECGKCGKYGVVNSGGGCMHSDCAKTECDGDVAETEGPMMNYYYPLPAFPTDIAKACLAIKYLPLVIVRLGGDDHKAALALSGGGMDLSWEICEAFMRLGYLPPTHFGLPAMCGRGISAKDRWILRGYLRACQVQRNWIARKADRAREAVAFGVKHEQERLEEQGRRSAR